MALLADLTRGSVAGALGTWVMDLITTGVQQQQGLSIEAREAAARPNGKPSVENLVDRLQTWTGIEIPEEQRPLVEQVVHFGLGVVPGAIYATIRRAPLAGSTRGLALGLLLWALNDEILNSRLGLAGHSRPTRSRRICAA
jgi:hypothetical protein